MKNSKPYISQNHFADWMEDPDKMKKRTDGNPSKLTAEQQKNCDFGHMIHNRAKLLYSEGIEPIDNRSFQTRLNQSAALLKARIPVFEPLFDFGGISAQIDILVPDGEDAWELIEVKSAKKIHDNWIKYTAFQYYVCINAGIKVSKCSIMHLKSWVDENTKLEETFDKPDISDKVISLQDEIDGNIKEIREQIREKKL